MTQRMPLTDFIIAMMKTDPAKLAKADPVKLAERYGIEPEHAVGYLKLWRG